MPKSCVQLTNQVDALRDQAESAKRDEVAGVVVRIKKAIAIYRLTVGKPLTDLSD